MGFYYLLIGTSLCAQFITTQYANDVYCVGTPTEIIGFNVTSPSAWYPSEENERWPIIYFLLAPVYPYNNCGAAPLAPPVNDIWTGLSGTCCYSVIDPSKYADYAQGISSGVTIEVNSYDENSIVSALPIFEKPAKYCKITNSMINGTGIFGYYFTYLLNIDFCLSERLKCSSNGTLTVFAENGCNGKSNSYTLTNNRQYINDALGSVYAEYSELSSGTNKVEWVTFKPSNYNVPNHKLWLEVFGVILFAISLIIAVGALIFTIVRLFTRATTHTILMLISKISIIFFLVFRIIYAYVIFEEYTDMLIFRGINSWTFGVSTLISVITTTRFAIVSLSLRKNVAVLLYITVFFIHIIGCGESYIMFFFELMEYDASNIIQGKTQFFGVLYFFRYWYNFTVYWTIFFFAYNFFPPIAIIWKVTSYLSEDILAHINIIFKLDRRFIWTIFAQFIACFMYYGSSFLQLYTTILENDRNSLAMDSVQAVSIALNALLGSYAITRVTVVINGIPRMQNKLKDPQTEQSKTRTKVAS